MKTFKKHFATSLLAVGLILVSFISQAQQLRKMEEQPEWSKDYPPFRIVGNLYYVGTYDLASYLIVIPKGNILINTGLPGSDTMIRAHVEALGFKLADVKILLATNAHFDHVGAMAVVQQQTGARVMINEFDAPVLADGGSSDYVLGGKGMMFLPVKADRLLHNHDTIKLGSMQIIALHHPGHTKGASSFMFDVKDEHRTYRVLIANMPSILSETKLAGMPGYPNVGKDYAYTLNAMKNLQFDIFLASHASQFDLQKKHKPGDAYNPEAFVDRAGYDEAMDALQKNHGKRLAEK
jgi:metallo-beta-lactamase class B